MNLIRLIGNVLAINSCLSPAGLRIRLIGSGSDSREKNESRSDQIRSIHTHYSLTSGGSSLLLNRYNMKYYSCDMNKPASINNRWNKQMDAEKKEFD